MNKNVEPQIKFRRSYKKKGVVDAIFPTRVCTFAAAVVVVILVVVVVAVVVVVVAVAVLEVDDI